MFLEEYLDRYAALARALYEMGDITLQLGDDIKVCACQQMSRTRLTDVAETTSYEQVPCVQMYTGLREVARIMNITLHEQERDSDTDAIWINYNGVQFIELEDKKND